ncbi:MAG: GTP 3',8-cyclase MoaA [Promethearchaeota archaeon]
MEHMLKDNFNRTIDYLRLSVNRACSFNCLYCDEEGYRCSKNPNTTRLLPGDVQLIIQFLNEVASIKKVKITGGEPLQHQNIIEIISVIRECKSIQEISLTTNGYALAGMAGKLKDAGLNRINISLCSLKEDTFQAITGIDGLQDVLRGIAAATNAGMEPIKINHVLLKGMNDSELDEMLHFCGNRNLTLQLIELHEVEAIHQGKGSFFKERWMDVNEALSQISLPVAHVEYRNMQHRKIITYENGARVELVKVTPAFCKHCSKLRVTADGQVKPCLMVQGENLDLLGTLKQGNRQELQELMDKVMESRKPFMTC